jgi:hypothetical protein
MIEEPLRAWLPSKEEFESFAGKVSKQDLQSFVADIDCKTSDQEKYVK